MYGAIQFLNLKIAFLCISFLVHLLCTGCIKTASNRWKLVIICETENRSTQGNINFCDLNLTFKVDLDFASDLDLTHSMILIPINDII